MLYELSTFFLRKQKEKCWTGLLFLFCFYVPRELSMHGTQKVAVVIFLSQVLAFRLLYLNRKSHKFIGICLAATDSVNDLAEWLQDEMTLLSSLSCAILPAN